MNTAIVVFAKTLGLSPVKTRLGADIGTEAAQTFYKLSVQALKEVLNMAKAEIQPPNSLEIYWALAEESGPQHIDWKGCKALWTGDGDLGLRLYNVTQTLFEKHSHVIMIGTDSPQINTELIHEAIMQMERNPTDCVVGPCLDGGFYLFGSPDQLGKDIWTGVTYSQEDTLKQLLSKMDSADMKYQTLQALSDVDHGRDLEVLREAFEGKVGLCEGQLALVEWLAGNESCEFC